MNAERVHVPQRNIFVTCIIPFCLEHILQCKHVLAIINCMIDCLCLQITEVFRNVHIISY
jgi:hypothetical protein